MKIVLAPECIIRRIERDERDSVWMLPNIKLNFPKLMARQEAGEIEWIGAFVGGRAIGQAVLKFRVKNGVEELTGGKTANVDNLHVSHHMRNIGVGTALITYAEKHCAECGFQYIGLGVNVEDNPRAYNLYLRLGFKNIGHSEYVSWDAYDDDGKVIGRDGETCHYLIKPLR